MRWSDPGRIGPFVFTFCLLVGLTALAASPYEVGTHIPLQLDTPRDYKGPASGEPETGWSYRLVHPGATYIALHFVDFDLGRGDMLIVSDANRGQLYTMSGRGKMNAGTFWAQHIKGDTVLLDLIKVDREGGHGFLIDEYVAGFVDLRAPAGGDRAICGTDDKENAKCYEFSYPTEYDRGRAVCRLLTNGSAFCTGWLASAQNHVFTNQHCIGTPAEALNTDYDFMAEAPTCDTQNCADCFPGTIFSGATLIQVSSNLDYCLVQINDGNPAASFGYLEIDNRVAIPGEEIYIIGHPGGRAKEFSIFSTEPYDGGIAKVYSITEPPCMGSGYYDVGYYADTEGGSSGSCVLARSSHKVIALHHCANCPNRGVPINLVYAETAQFLTPGPAGQVALDKEHYGCADSVGIEMRDGDLQGAGTHAVAVTTDAGDAEEVTLTETGSQTAIFQGSIATAPGSIVVGDGVLQVVHGQTITVTYIDADNGQGQQVTVTDTAAVDCVPPQILNVQTTDVQPRSATVTITADEPVRGTVHYGLSCDALLWTAQGTGFATSATVELAGLQDNTTYYYTADATDEAGNTAVDLTCRSFTTPEVPDFFTELFTSNDTDNLSFTFVPNSSSDFYWGCVEPITELPTDPTGGTTLTLTDDSFATVNLGGGALVSLYGVNYNHLYVGSNGYVTFASGDTSYTESLAAHFNQPRVSALFDDLHPGQGGTVSWKQLSDRVAITWLNVPEISAGNQNTFQIELLFDGQIKINFLAIAATDGLAGLSAGNGVPPDFYMSDLSALGPCQAHPPTASNGTADTDENTPVNIALQAEDDGLPNPPGSLTYIITALAAHGSLADPSGGVIAAVPYTLLGGGNLVQYTPAAHYIGADSFEFKANDGGTPPDGGDSNLATVTINVIGVPERVYSFTLDSDPGWATTGAWAFGDPLGLGSHLKDPQTGHTGVNVYGYNLAGDYANNLTPKYLTTTALDCSHYTAVELRFWRWLGVEASDHAGIEMSTDGTTWTPVWSNITTISEGAWSLQAHSLGAAADHQPTVYIRWVMGPTDVSVTYPGWNLDDIEIWALAPPPATAGDLNCDGSVDFADINPFVLYLSNYAAWLTTYAGCNPLNGDINGDGLYPSFADINPFVALLTGS